MGGKKMRLEPNVRFSLPTNFFTSPAGKKTLTTRYLKNFIKQKINEMLTKNGNNKNVTK